MKDTLHVMHGVTDGGAADVKQAMKDFKRDRLVVDGKEVLNSNDFN